MRAQDPSATVSGVPASARRRYALGLLFAIYFIHNCKLVGAGAGPQLSGALSDALPVHGDAQSLAHALAVILLLAVVPDTRAATGSTFGGTLALGAPRRPAKRNQAQA